LDWKIKGRKRNNAQYGERAIKFKGRLRKPRRVIKRASVGYYLNGKKLTPEKMGQAG